MPRTYYQPSQPQEPVKDIDYSIGLVPYMCNINHAGVNEVYMTVGAQMGFAMRYPITDNERHAVEIKMLHYITEHYDDTAAKDDRWMVLMNNQLIRTKFEAYRDKNQLLPWLLANRKQRKDFEMAVIPELLRLEEAIRNQLHTKVV